MNLVIQHVEIPGEHCFTNLDVKSLGTSIPKKLS